MEERINQIALGLLYGIGPRRAKILVSHIGSLEGVFKEKTTSLGKIPGIGTIIAQNLKRQDSLNRAERELKFIEQNQIKAHFYTDQSYPKHLSYCEDSPIVLYSKGKANFNSRKNIAVVGTRKASEYGKQLVKDLLFDLKDFNVQIISGLAYGIDVTAHQAALEFKIPTIGVLAHGLDVLYPVAHQSIAKKMQEQGGLITEFLSETIPDKENFPKRNRIVAGMSEATIVVESAQKGGSLITAGLANDYNRDVFAYPGNVGRHSSIGCNQLIQKDRAHLITCAQDLIDILGWEKEISTSPVQAHVFNNLSQHEVKIVSVLKEKGSTPIDLLSHLSQTKVSDLLVQLFNLEMKGVIRALPGKCYEFI